MDYEIKRIFEKGNNLYVEVEHDFGVDVFGFGLNSRKLDPETDKPRFLSELDVHLHRKYGDDVRKTKEVYSEFKGVYKAKGVNVKK